MTEIVQASTPEQIAGVRAIMEEYVAWAKSFGRRDIKLDDIPACKGYEDEFANLPGIYTPPDGRLLLALENGRPAGVVALKRVGPETGEVKRLYVRPQFRGAKIGWQIVGRLV